MKKTKAFFLVIATVIATLMIVTFAKAYEYESEIDPARFFEYQAISFEQIGANRMIVYLKSDKHTPRCATNLVQKSAGGVVILSYAYLDMNGKVLVFNLIGTRYTKMTLDEPQRKFFGDMLYKLNGMTGV